MSTLLKDSKLSPTQLLELCLRTSLAKIFSVLSIKLEPTFGTKIRLFSLKRFSRVWSKLFRKNWRRVKFTMQKPREDCSNVRRNQTSRRSMWQIWWAIVKKWSKCFQEEEKSKALSNGLVNKLLSALRGMEKLFFFLWNLKRWRPCSNASLKVLLFILSIKTPKLQSRSIDQFTTLLKNDSSSLELSTLKHSSKF